MEGTQPVPGPKKKTPRATTTKTEVLKNRGGWSSALNRGGGKKSGMGQRCARKPATSAAKGSLSAIGPGMAREVTCRRHGRKITAIDGKILPDRFGRSETRQKIRRIRD